MGRRGNQLTKRCDVSKYAFFAGEVGIGSQGVRDSQGGWGCNGIGAAGCDAPKIF